MFQTLLSDARLCNAIYAYDKNTMAHSEATTIEAFAKEGHTVIDIFLDDSHKAVLSKPLNDSLDYSNIHLTICGSRVTTGTIPQIFGDLYDDIDMVPLEIEPGIFVPAGPWAGCKELFEWAQIRSEGSKLIIKGHSLGGRSRYARYFLPPELISHIVSFGAPKFASVAFWQKYLKPGDIICIYHRDLWAGWPFDLWNETPWSQPPGQSILYIEDNNFCRITEQEWLGGLLPEDHSIDGAYIPALENLAKVFGNGD